MNAFLSQSLFFGVTSTLTAYLFGLFLKKHLKSALFNPILISAGLIIVLLMVSGIEYDAYNNGAKYLSYLLTPTTVCLAIPLYEQIALLKQNLKAIFIGIASGVIASLSSVFALSLIFGLNHIQYVTLLPKSITTAIGMQVSEELGGLVTITVAVIILTGIFGNMIADQVCRLFKIDQPIAKGIAIGTASHAVGTAKALELGEIEGAMSSLAIVVSGLMTVAIISLFATLI
jgi:predicted murein hydrolase (TIGR00659 family)